MDRDNIATFVPFRLVFISVFVHENLPSLPAKLPCQLSVIYVLNLPVRKQIIRL